MASSHDTEPPLLDHTLIPPDEFLRKMRAVVAVPKHELDERLEAERQANAEKPKRGPKPKEKPRA